MWDDTNPDAIRGARWGAILGVVLWLVGIVYVAFC